MGTGAYGIVYCFVRNDYIASMQSRDERQDEEGYAPKYVVVKVSSSNNLDCVKSECMRAYDLIEDEKKIPLVKSSPLTVLSTENDEESSAYVKIWNGTYVCVSVMPMYDTDLYQFVQNATNRERLRKAGQAGFLRIASQILDVLIHLRAHDMWYDDLKLSNILVDLNSSTEDNLVCVVGDVGAIYKRSSCNAVPGTFPSPMSIIENVAISGSLWCFAIFIVEYAVNLHEVTHMRALLYENMKHDPTLKNDERYEKACRARLNMKMLSWSIPEKWETVRKIHEMCCPLGHSTYEVYKDTDLMNRIRLIIDTDLT
eukprot:gene9632-11416_t